MQLQGSCHCGSIKFSVRSAEPVPFMRCYCSICRKTAGGGGYAINLGAEAASLKLLKGKRQLRVYQARMPGPGKDGDADAAEHRSSGQRHFCGRCGTALWLYDPQWPDLIHPHASAIDTPLPVPPEHVHIMLGSKSNWVPVEGLPGDARFDDYPDCSLAEWHARRGLTSAAD
jgi:hypothetical protein